MEKAEVQSDVKRYKSVATLAEHDGGKLLIRGLEKDIVADIEAITSLYKGEEIELRAAAINLKTHLALLRTLTRARGQAKLAMAALKAIELEEQSNNE